MKFLFWPILRELRDLRDDVASLHRDLQAARKALIAQGNYLMAASDDLKAIAARMDATTTKIAEDVRVLKDKVTTGMSPADVEDVKASFSAVADRLDAVDAENPEGTV